ncbi:MAG: ion transporter [Methanobacteriales archaeon]|nr:ion transporter [Methanobacteriales archaeon]
MSSNQKKLKYKELTLNVLILIDIIAITYISFYPSSPVLIYSINIFDFLLCVILFIEFLYNIKMKKDKWVFIKENWTDILAFIPIYYFRIFRFTRLIRLLRLLKILALFRKYLKGLFKFLLETHMDQAIGILLFAMFCGTLLFYSTEWGVNPSLKSLADSLWHTITTTMAGEVIIAPITFYGKLITILLMFVGITFFGFLTASLASWFVKNPEEEKELQDRIKFIEKKIDKLQNEIKELKEIMKKY